MSTPAPVSPWSIGKLRLRTFVAWSLIAHIGAGFAWGLPALLDKQAEMDLEQMRKDFAENIRTETVKAKAAARENRIEATRKQVEAQLKEQFEKLATALPEAKRETLWEELARQLSASERAFADALGNADISEQDLRSLEAQLQRELVEQLDQRLASDAAEDLAAAFIAQVDSQVAPDLAAWMQEQVRERVAKRAREQADSLVREQRDAANRQRDSSVKAARDARDRVAEADDLAKRDREDAKRSQQRMQESAQRLERAAKQLATAAERAPDLGAVAQDRITWASNAVTQAQRAVDAAKSVVAAKEPVDAAAKTEALAKADAALATARQATATAVETLERADGREEQAKTDLRKLADRELQAAAEQAFTAEFRAETVPRLTPKLAQAFKQQLQRNGIDDAKLVEAVAAKAGELLAKRVPELARAGEQIEQRFADLAPPPAPGSADQAGQTDAPKPIDVGLAAQGGTKSELDRKLDAGKEKLLKEATERVGQVAKDGRRDGEAIRLAAGSGASDDAALDMRERVGRLAEGMRNGRVGGLGTSGLGGLRQGALLRGLLVDTRRRIDRDLYEKTAAEIADRGRIQGERWQQTGATGAASQAQRAAGTVPARAAGADNAQAKTTSSNTHPYQPSFKSLAFTAIPCLPGDFAIDGTADKWKDIAAVPLKPEHGNDPSTQLMQLGWRSDGLFCRFAITDPDRTLSKTTTGAFWVGDTVEVWIDNLNAKEKYRARHAGQQFWIWPDGAADDPAATGGESVVEQRGGRYVPRNLHRGEMPRATTMTPTGYIVEFRLPAERLVDADFSPGRIVGFNAYVSTKSTTDWYWSAGKDAGTYGQPDTWGDLLLAGSDASIELADRPHDAQPSQRSEPELLLPGQPVHLRVIDGDMNLSPTQRDKVMVTLQPGHGGQHVVVLEETGASTGVFEGSASTALAVGDDQPGTLAVYEGERVDVVYLDQARANGARNAEVRLQLRFATALIHGIAPQ